MNPSSRKGRSALLALLLSVCALLSNRAAAQASGEVEAFTPLPVGVLLRGQDTGNVIIVLGSEANGQAANFSRWQLALQDVLSILQVESRPSEADPGVLELTSPFLRTTLDTAELTESPDLGLAITTEQVREVFSTPLSFDASVFAINFEAPEPGASVRQAEGLPPLSLEGLEPFDPPPFTLSSVSQSLRASSALTLEDPQVSGETQLAGGLLGGSYYLRLDEGDLLGPEGWVLDEARYFLPGDELDYLLGVYDPFWDLDEDFAGLTLTYRSGFEVASRSTGGSSLLPRDIVGEAEPGSVVRLVETGRETLVIAEVLVDSTGIYRFEDVPTSGDETRYTVLVYPGGLLSAEPLRREFDFAAIEEQIPVGAFSVTAAAGAERAFLAADEAGADLSLPVLGAYGGVAGALAARYGALEQLTLGAGVVYDDGLRAFGEGFFAPDGLPLRAAVRGTSPVLYSLLPEDEPEDAETFALEGRLDYAPLENLTFEGVASETLGRFGVRYSPVDEVQLRADADSADLALFGVRVLNVPLGRLQNFADAEINLAGEFRFSVSLRDPETGLSFRQSGNESALSTGLAFSPPEVLGGVTLGEGHELRLENEVRYEDGTLTWSPVYSYTSPLRTAGSQPLFGAQAGYTFRTLGFGAVQAEASRIDLSGRAGIVGGLYLEAGYQGLFNPETDRITLGLAGSYTLSSGGLVPSASLRPTEEAEGGAVIAVFFDRNGDGDRDAGEELYAENLELLLKLTRTDNTEVRVSETNVTAEVTQVPLAAGSYRLDLDPAGYPLNFTPAATSYAVRVSPGVYTSVEVPLTPSFSRIGVLRDRGGNPVVGARVEAVGPGGERAFSITSAAGVYYLDGLTFGQYRLLVLDQPTDPAVLTLDESSEPYAELDLSTAALGAE